MTRGDLITVAIAGDYGKPRPAVVIQADVVSDTKSVLVCLLTSDPFAASYYRLKLMPSPENGLRKPSDIMVDKIAAVPRAKCRPPIGRLTADENSELNQRLSFMLGLAG